MSARLMILLGRRLQTLAAVAVIAVGLASSPAHAQWAVFDAANFIKNTMTAAQTYQQYAQQLMDYAMQANQYMTMLRNLERMPLSVLNTAIGREIISQAGGDPQDPNSWNGLQPGDVLKAAKEVYNVYRTSARLMSEGGQLYQRASNWGQEMNWHSAGSGMTWEQIFAYEQQRAKAGQDLAQWRYRQAQDMVRQMQGFQQRADQQLKAAGEAEGAVQAISATAAMNHTISDQLSSLIASSARQEAAAAEQFGRDRAGEDEFARSVLRARKGMEMRRARE
jgi:hypothetical protein